VSRQKFLAASKIFLIFCVFGCAFGIRSVAFAAGYYNMVALWRAQAITVDGSTSLFGGGSISSLTLATPAATRAGDLLFMCMEKDGSAATITPPSGWTQFGSTVTDGSGAGTLYMYSKVATYSDASGGGSYTWSWSSGGTFASIGMFALRGASTVDTWVSATGTSDGGTLTSGSLTASQTSEPLIAFFHNNSGTTLSGSAPLTTDQAPGGSGFFGGHLILAAQGASSTYSVIGAANASWQSVLISFRH
jgi:hypothetical protein